MDQKEEAFELTDLKAGRSKIGVRFTVAYRTIAMALAGLILYSVKYMGSSQKESLLRDRVSDSITAVINGKLDVLNIQFSNMNQTLIQNKVDLGNLQKQVEKLDQAIRPYPHSSSSILLPSDASTCYY